MKLNIETDLFDSVKRLATQVVRRLYRAGSVLLKGTYDAAVLSPENRRHWANAKDNTPQSENTRETRKRLRINARYETDNNSYCRGMVSTLGTDLLGPVAPQLQALSPDAGLNTAVEEAYRLWSECEEVNLPEKLHILDEAKLVEGEGFLVHYTDDEAERYTGNSLNVHVMSPRRVQDPTLFGLGYSAIEGNRLNDDGVIVDLSTGRPVEYKIVPAVDDINGLGFVSNTQTVRARFVRQWFTATRPGQYRGVCEITAGLPLFAYLRRFTLATVSNAEILASLTAFMKTTQTPAEGPASIDAWAEFPITRGMLNSLPDGWEPVTLDPKHPASTYEMFVNMILREVGRMLNIPFGVMVGDSSKYNYSSARLDYRGYEDRLTRLRRQLNIRVLNPLFREFLVALVLQEPKLRTMLDSGKFKHSWRYANRPSIDPYKDAQTEDLRLKNGAVTYAEVYADRGEDWAEAFEQRKREEEKIKELGLKFGGTEAPTESKPGEKPPAGDMSDMDDEENMNPNEDEDYVAASRNGTH